MLDRHCGFAILRWALLFRLAGECAWAVGALGQGPGPANAPAPPADPVALIKTVAENQKQIEAVRKDYIFHRRDEDQELDSQGHWHPKEVKEYEVYFLGLWEIERLLSKNGKLLTEKEQQKQEEEVRKQEAKAREKMAKEESGANPDKNTITLAKFLASDRFYNLRRQTYEGREVYAMDFAPRPDFQPHSLVDRVLKALGGTLWIDEQAKQGVRLEARFLEGLKVGGGLIGSVQKGGNVVLEQRFVNGEVWMPSFIEIHLNAHLFLIHKAINGTATYSDYRKFHVESKITGTAPATPPTPP